MQRRLIWIFNNICDYPPAIIRDDWRKRTFTFKMENTIKNQTRDLENIESGVVEMPLEVRKSLGLEKVGDNFMIWGDANIDGCNSIHIYDGRKYLRRNITSRREFDEEKTHLRWAFSKSMFNLFSYINQGSEMYSSFLAHIPNVEVLEKVFGQIEMDISGGHLPFEYNLAEVFNVNKARRSGGSLI